MVDVFHMHCSKHKEKGNKIQPANKHMTSHTRTHAHACSAAAA